MRHIFSNRIAMAVAVALLAGAAEAAGPPSGPLSRCPADAVVSGAGCMDRYEASVIRGGDFNAAGLAGPVAVFSVRPSVSIDSAGFRCVR